MHGHAHVARVDIASHLDCESAMESTASVNSSVADEASIPPTPYIDESVASSAADERPMAAELVAPARRPLAHAAPASKLAAHAAGSDRSSHIARGAYTHYGAK